MRVFTQNHLDVMQALKRLTEEKHFLFPELKHVANEVSARDRGCLGQVLRQLEKRGMVAINRKHFNNSYSLTMLGLRTVQGKNPLVQFGKDGKLIKKENDE